MIIARVEHEVAPGKANEAVELQKSLYAEGGIFHNKTKGYRVYRSYYSKGPSVVVEMHFDSLGEFEAVHSATLSKVSADEWSQFHEIFSGQLEWTYWFLAAEG